MSMYDKLDDEPEHPDTEITLGLRSILGIFFGLVLICGVFFGFGYSLGRSNAVKPSAASAVTAQSATSAPAPVTTVVEQPGSSSASNTSNASTQSKPSGAVAQTVQPATTTQSLTTAAASEGSAPTGPAPAPADQAKPASYTIPAQAGSASNPSYSAPSATRQTPIMVQVAAISRPQDADVLISALQQRGFNASARRDASDNLLHVQIGPFTTRQQALDMRARLLNDGYNAILK